MTETQATELVTMLRAAAAKSVESDTIEYFIARLTTLEYQPAMNAATIGAGLWRFFPSWAEFMEMYRAQKAALGEPVGEQRAAAPPEKRGPREIPFWVKRWIAARFLYHRFGREQDRRAFREQESSIDFTSGPVEWMPDEEWNDEAHKVSDKEVWGILTSPKTGEYTF